MNVAEWAERFAETALLKSVSVSSSDLEAAWMELVGSDADQFSSRFEEAFLRSVDPEAAATLQFRLGGWSLNLSEGVLKSGLVGAFLAVTLVAGGLPALPAMVLPAIAPLLFDTRQIRLTRRESYILASLTLRDDVRSHQHSPDALYELLPIEIQNELSRLDFRDFVEKCFEAGVADITAGGLVTVRPESDSRFRVTIQ